VETTKDVPTDSVTTDSVTTESVGTESVRVEEAAGNAALDSRTRRLRWSYLPLSLSALPILSAVVNPWYTFGFDGTIQAQVGGEVVRDVSASATLSARATAEAAGSVLWGHPRPLVLLVAALCLGAVAVSTKFWLSSLAGLVVLVPMVVTQLEALRSSMELGPGGHLLTAGPGLAAFNLALWFTALALVLTTVASRAARKMELEAARAAALAAGKPVAPPMGDLLRGAINARLRVPAASSSSEG
jgi:cytochrome c-type biogenesis protein CcmH/NrfF